MVYVSAGIESAHSGVAVTQQSIRASSGNPHDYLSWAP